VLKDDYIFAPHQEEGHALLEKNQCNALFWDMGTFKTSTIIGHVERSRHNYKHVLIVVLKDNLKTWNDELNDRLTEADHTILPHTLATRKKAIKNYITEGSTKYLVVNYDCIRSDHLYDMLRGKAQGFDLIVFDECYALHNTQAARNKRWYNIRTKIPRCTIMDGDPTAEGEEKLFGMYKMMDMGRTFGTQYWPFMEKYFVRIDDTFWQPGRYTLQQINAVLRETSMRVHKKDVLPWLPPVVYETRMLDMSSQQKKMYNQMTKEFAVELSDGDILEVDYKIAQIQKLRQLTGGFMYVPDAPPMKIPNAKLSTAREVMRQNKKLVVWAQYREELDMLHEMSKMMGRKPVVYHGGVTGKDKDIAKEAFKSDDSINDFIGQVDCGIGMNELVVSGTALYYSRSDKRRSRSQSVARLDRPGQKHDKVTIIDIVCHSTIDESNYKRLKKKGKRSEMLLNYNDHQQLIGALRGRL